jgi:hypothetical protein
MTQIGSDVPAPNGMDFFADNAFFHVGAAAPGHPQGINVLKSNFSMAFAQGNNPPSKGVHYNRDKALLEHEVWKVRAGGVNVRNIKYMLK